VAIVGVGTFKERGFAEGLKEIVNGLILCVEEGVEESRKFDW
jgi:hypothetical protein